MDIESACGVNYLELVAEKLIAADTRRLADNKPTGYFEPGIMSGGIEGGIKGVALDYYLRFAPKPVSHFNQVLAKKELKHYQANIVGEGLVAICFFAPMKKRFKQLYYVMSRHQGVGIYIDGDLIGSVEKSNPVVTMEMMKPYLSNTAKVRSEMFCEEMSEAAKEFVANATVR